MALEFYHPSLVHILPISMNIRGKYSYQVRLSVRLPGTFDDPSWVLKIRVYVSMLFVGVAAPFRNKRRKEWRSARISLYSSPWSLDTFQSTLCLYSRVASVESVSL